MVPTKFLDIPVLVLLDLLISINLDNRVALRLQLCRSHFPSTVTNQLFLVLRVMLH